MDGRTAYVVSGRTVAAIDLPSGTVKPTFDLAESSAHDVRISRDGRRLWAACVRASRRPTAAGCQPALVMPLAPQRFKVQLTIGQETHDKLRRVQDLLRHCMPSGDPAVIFDRALTVLGPLNWVWTQLSAWSSILGFIGSS